MSTLVFVSCTCLPVCPSVQPDGQSSGVFKLGVEMDEKGWTWMGPKRSLFFLQLVETAQDLLRIPVLRQQADRMSGAPQE